MAKKSWIVKSQKTPKFSVRHNSRCMRCGRSRAYMRKFGVVEVASDVYRVDERPLTDVELDGAVPDDDGVLRKPVTLDSAPPLVGEAGSVGIEHADGSRTFGWLTPSRKLEVYSTAVTWMATQVVLRRLSGAEAMIPPDGGR